MFKMKMIAFSQLGGGWAWVLSNDLFLMCRTNVDRYSSAGVGGLCFGIFSSLQGWLCVGILCALQCAKNSVGSGRQSHGCLYMYRMFNRVTYNGQSLLLCWYFIMSSPKPQPIEKLMMKITTKADRITSAGYGLIAI